MTQEGTIKLEIDSKVIEKLIQLKIPGAQIYIQEEPPEIKIKYSILSVKFIIKGINNDGEIILCPSGAAGKITSLFKGSISAGDRIRMAEGNLYIKILPVDLPFPVKVKNIKAEEGRIKLVLEI